MLYCKSCNSEMLFNALDLGEIPIGEEVLKFKQDVPELFKTNMLLCLQCGLGQLSLDVSKERMFSDYFFKTSESKSFLDHSEKYMNDIISRFGLTKNDWILEIASNDGYLLKMFKEKGYDVLGVDPAKNIATYAICDGVPTIVDFFGSEVAKQILKIKGYPKLIVANNVMAHVPDISDFMHGISILCNDKTIVSIENPSIMNILEKDQFDSVYHGHYSYLSANSVSVLANKFQLNLFDIEQVPVHGVSNRYWVSKFIQQQDSVLDYIKYEINNGLFNIDVWNKYVLDLQKRINVFYSKVENIIKSGGKVCGYAASSKCTTLLNFAKIHPEWITCVADDMLDKQGKFIPGLNIPIVSLDEMLSNNPTDVIIFSWNIYDELLQKLSDKGHQSIKVWMWND